MLSCMGSISIKYSDCFDIVKDATYVFSFDALERGQKMKQRVLDVIKKAGFKVTLQNNAFEAWAMSIRYCDHILEGKATLEYCKHFVSALHNAVELFVKQLMLNNTDYRVI